MQMCDSKEQDAKSDVTERERDVEQNVEDGERDRERVQVK